MWPLLNSRVKTKEEEEEETKGVQCACNNSEGPSVPTQL